MVPNPKNWSKNLFKNAAKNYSKFKYQPSVQYSIDQLVVRYRTSTNCKALPFRSAPSATTPRGRELYLMTCISNERLARKDTAIAVIILCPIHVRPAACSMSRNIACIVTAQLIAALPSKLCLLLHILHEHFLDHRDVHRKGTGTSIYGDISLDILSQIILF